METNEFTSKQLLDFFNNDNALCIKEFFDAYK